MNFKETIEQTEPNITSSMGLIHLLTGRVEEVDYEDTSVNASIYGNYSRLLRFGNIVDKVNILKLIEKIPHIVLNENRIPIGACTISMERDNTRISSVRFKELQEDNSFSVAYKVNVEELTKLDESGEIDTIKSRIHKVIKENKKIYTIQDFICHKGRVGIVIDEISLVAKVIYNPFGWLSEKHTRTKILSGTEANNRSIIPSVDPLWNSRLGFNKNISLAPISDTLKAFVFFSGKFESSSGVLTKFQEQYYNPHNILEKEVVEELYKASPNVIHNSGLSLMNEFGGIQNKYLNVLQFSRYM